MGMGSSRSCFSDREHPCCVCCMKTTMSEKREWGLWVAAMMAMMVLCSVPLWSVRSGAPTGALFRTPPGRSTKLSLAHAKVISLPSRTGGGYCGLTLVHASPADQALRRSAPVGFHTGAELVHPPLRSPTHTVRIPAHPRASVCINLCIP